MIDKIIKLFNSINKPALVILRTPRAGEEVDNMCGAEFPLREYAVIHKGDLMGDDESSIIVYRWCRDNDCDLLKFDSERCKPNVEDLCDQLKEMDGYEIVWNLNTK